MSHSQGLGLEKKHQTVTEREETHKKAFTKWLNSRLAQANPPLIIRHLENDLSDGIALLNLLEVLLDTNVARNDGKTRVHKLSNVQRALQICQNNKIQLGGINAPDIVNGNRKAILGLIWNIILHFQMQGPTNSDSKDYSIEKALQGWCKDRLERYKDHVTVKDFSNSWRDGLAFNALLHSYRQSLFDFDKIVEQDNYTRLDNAFTTAHLVWDVPRLLEPSDIDVEKPDKKMITMYLSCLYEKISANPTGSLPEGVVMETSSEESITHASNDPSNFIARDKRDSPLTIQQNGTAHVNGESMPNVTNGTTHVTKSSPLVTKMDSIDNAHVTQSSTLATHTAGSSTFETSRITREVTQRSVTTYRTPTFIHNNDQKSDAKKKVFFLKKRKSSASSDTSHKVSDSDALEFPTIRIQEMKTIQVGSVAKSRSSTPSTSSRSSETEMIESPSGTAFETDGSKFEDWDLSGTLNHAKIYSFSSISDIEPSPEAIRRATAVNMSTPITKEAWDEGDGMEPLTGKSEDADSAIADMDPNTLREPSPSKHEYNSVFDTTENSTSSEKSYRAAVLVDLKKRDYNTSDPTMNVNCKEYLARRLGDVETAITDLEQCIPVAHTATVDLASAKKTMDETKVIVYTRTKLELEAFEVTKLGRAMVEDEYFDLPTSQAFTYRMDDLEDRLEGLREQGDKEMTRLYDLYVILLRQNFERMHDWLVRAETKMTLEDSIGPTYDDVARQQREHFNFQKELGVYSSVNMIFEIDMEDLMIDKALKEQVKAVSERWAAVWNWAEERKQRLNEVLFDWEQLRDKELSLLEWMSGKEEALELIGNTDITNDEEVAEHTELLEAVIRLLSSESQRIDVLHDVSERLITDAQYDDKVAQPIRDEVQDFDDCWQSALENAEKRSTQLMDSRRKFLDMSVLVKDTKQWLTDVEELLETSREFQNKEEEKSFYEKIEIKCEERSAKQTQLDTVGGLERELDEDVDEPSHEAMRAVNNNLTKRFQEACEGLERSREGLPHHQHEDCCFVRYLKKGLRFVS